MVDVTQGECDICHRELEVVWLTDRDGVEWAHCRRCACVQWRLMLGLAVEGEEPASGRPARE